MNGSSLRCPEASGGNSRARLLANWQSMPLVDHSWPTDNSESRMDGQIPHGDARSGFPVYARYCFGAGTQVSQVFHMGMNVIGASAVHYESDMFALLAQVTGVSIAEAS
eukprot:4135556-Pleurochrysis_carterae.AAC.3